MTQTQAEKLAADIPHTGAQTLKTKVGRTNGAYVVHVVNTEARASETLRSVGEWLAHDWNRLNRRRKARPTTPEAAFDPAAAVEGVRSAAYTHLSAHAEAALTRFFDASKQGAPATA